jgi:hypothetical protein
MAAAFSLADTGAISAGELDYLGSTTAQGRPFTATAVAADSHGRGTVTLVDNFGTHITAAYYVISATELLWFGTDNSTNYGMILGHVLKQTGRPFASLNALTQAATFYGEMEGNVPGETSGARVGTITPASLSNTFTMTYRQSFGDSSADTSGNFIIDVGDDGRATGSDADTGATSVLYFVSSNKGFIVGSTVPRASPRASSSARSSRRPERRLPTAR